MYKIIKDFDYKDYIGDLFSLKEFMEHNECGGITPDDGCIGEVVIDGKEVNIEIDEYGSWLKDPIIMSLKDLKKIKGKKQIVWCNK